jgi:hypothetical protein
MTLAKKAVARLREEIRMSSAYLTRLKLEQKNFRKMLREII